MIVVTGAIRVVLAMVTGLGNGESYYFSCAQQPLLGYIDHPPLSMWMGWAGMKLLGGPCKLALRGVQVLMFAGSTWLMFAITRRLFGQWAGLLAAVALNISIVFTLTTACFFQPDGALVLFWLACAYCLVRIFFDEPLRRPML